VNRQRNRGLTIVLVGGSSSGRKRRSLHVPGWAVSLLRPSAAALLFAIAFIGFFLQGEFGLDGPLVTQLGNMLQAGNDRYAEFMNVARERAGLTPDQVRRKVMLERAARLGLGDRRAASVLLVGGVEPAWRAEVERGAAAGDGKLMWPVNEGWYGRGYGSGEGGYHLAIDINAERGADVLAAASGIVGYAGRELRGFGNVVLLVHPGGLVTLYGHNERNLVMPGQRVKRGEPIASLGSTGRSMGPHVHFEFMYNGRNCDPMPLIAPGPASYRNFELTGPAMLWYTGAPKPDGLRCKKRMPHPQHEDDEAGETEPLALSQ
jgi:Peptidase family M23